VLDWDVVGKIVEIVVSRHKDKIPYSDYSMLLEGYQNKNEIEVMEALIDIMRLMLRTDSVDLELFDLVEKASKD
jgi:hypothetical protein